MIINNDRTLEISISPWENDHHKCARKMANNFGHITGVPNLQSILHSVANISSTNPCTATPHGLTRCDPTKLRGIDRWIIAAAAILL